MSLYSSAVPNLINGVSQQPASIRMSTQCNEMINCYPSVVEGLIKRPPLNHVAQLIAGDAGECKVHAFQRDATEEYVIVLRNGDIKVFDLEGTEFPVTLPSGAGYLAAPSPASDFSVVTVADYTFIVNQSVSVAMAADLSPASTGQGMVFVKQGAYSSTYSVKVDGVQRASYTTSASAATDIQTANIANQLATQLATNLGAGWTVERVGHVIVINKTDGTPFTLRTDGPLSGEALRSNTGTVEDLTDLPALCKQGHIVKIAGSNAQEADDYYVSFTANDGVFSDGFWRESAAPGTQTKLDASTMPHVLISNGTSFTFKPATWGERTAGDAVSAPPPSFVGQKIADVFFFRDRLGVIAGQNVVMTKAGEYFDFFPATVTTILDDGPIDLVASSSQVSTLRYAVPFNEQLLLFSDLTQFILDSADLLTPKSASIVVATEFESSRKAKPVGAGKNIYFATPKGGFSGLREYYTATDTRVHDASDVTAHVPQYIQGDVTNLSVSTAHDLLLASPGVSPSDSTLYLYKFYWQNNEKLQSAWGKWDLVQDSGVVRIRGHAIIGTSIYLAIQRDTDGLYLERVDIAPVQEDPHQGYLTHLDRRITEAKCASVTYDPVTDKTSFVLPYPIRSTKAVIVTRANAAGDSHGRVVKVEPYALGSSTLVVTGDYSTTPVWLGNFYRALYDPTEPVVKAPSSNGKPVAVQGGKVQVRNYLLAFNDTGAFTVNVTPTGRDTYVYEQTGRTLGAVSNIIGTPAISDGTFRCPIMANSAEFSLQVESWSHLPMKLQSAEWEYHFTIRSSRR